MATIINLIVLTILHVLDLHLDITDLIDSVL